MIQGSRKELSTKKEDLTHCKISTSTFRVRAVSRKSSVKCKYLGGVIFASLLLSPPLRLIHQFITESSVLKEQGSGKFTFTGRREVNVWISDADPENRDLMGP